MYCRSNLTQDLFVVSVPAFSFFFLHSLTHSHTQANGGRRCLCCTKLSPFVASLRPLNGSLCCPLIKHLQTVILATCTHARTHTDIRRQRKARVAPGVSDDVSAEPPKTFEAKNDSQLASRWVYLSCKPFALRFILFLLRLRHNQTDSNLFFICFVFFF